jgi:phage terminase large subunit-like protein
VPATATPPGFPTLEEFRKLPAAAQLQFLERVELEARKAEIRPWRKTARPKQLPPDDPEHHKPDAHGFRCGCNAVDRKYNIHLVMAGRGMGKTFMGANWIAEMAARHPSSEWAVLAPSFRDVRKTCFESDVGVIRALQPGEMTNYRRNELQIVLSNGSVIYGYSAENPDKVRGANLWGAWCDELASWRYPATWYEGLLPALRKGEHPRIVVTTTPRPVRLINDLVGRADGTVHITRGSTWENEANLSDIALAELRHRYEGTRLGRQELEGELLEDLEGALWNRRMLDEARVTEADVPDLVRVIVAVDPALSSDPESDETGIVVAGEGADGHGYILDDLSARVSPMQAMKIAIRAYRQWEADCVVAETNNGGDFIRDLLRNVDPQVPYKSIRASRGKAVRAQPVSALYEQGKVHHVGVFAQLEDQMCIAAGVQVLCRRGSVPVELVGTGDEVLTRAGWRPVLASGRTGHRSVITLTTSSGASVSCTPDHPVWVVGRGWTDAGKVHTGDTLCVCPESSAPTLSSGARSTSWKITATTGRPALAGGNFCTARYGPQPMALSPRAGKSITATVGATTALGPWKPAQDPSTLSGTLLAALPPGPRSSTQKPCDCHGQSGNLATSSALRAEHPSGPPVSAPCSARGSAVVSITGQSGATDVYDLTVAGEHEFFAGGVLVHNCLWVPESLDSPDRMDAMVWAVSELRGLGDASWASVYGTTRCAKCDRMFIKRDRRACPHCGHPVEQEDEDALRRGNG